MEKMVQVVKMKICYVNIFFYFNLMLVKEKNPKNAKFNTTKIKLTEPSWQNLWI